MSDKVILAILVVVIIIVIYYCCYEGWFGETIKESLQGNKIGVSAQEVFDALQQVRASGEGFATFQSILGTDDFPFDVYSDLRVKNVLGNLTLDIIRDRIRQ